MNCFWKGCVYHLDIYKLKNMRSYFCIVLSLITITLSSTEYLTSVNRFILFTQKYETVKEMVQEKKNSEQHNIAYITLHDGEEEAISNLGFATNGLSFIWSKFTQLPCLSTNTAH